MTVSDNMPKVKQDIDSVLNTQQQNQQHQSQQINRILQNHLQLDVLPDVAVNFAHKTAMVGLKGLKQMGSIISTQGQSESSSQPRDTTLLYGGGMAQDWSTPFGQSPVLTLGDTDTHTPIYYKHESKAKAKATMTAQEKKFFDEVFSKAKAKPKAKTQPKAKATPKATRPVGAATATTVSATASSSSQPPPAPVKKTYVKQKGLTTGTQISPSKIGIQKLGEELENAKNKNKLSTEDISSYTKLYDAWKGAKGDKSLKEEKIKGLRDLYKRVLYKKV